MTHLRTLLRRALVPALLLAPVPVVGLPPAGAGPAEPSSRRAAATVYVETFEQGTRRWTPSSGTRLSTVDDGRRSAQAARLHARRSGTAVAQTRVSAPDAAGTRHTVTAWLRSTRGPVRGALVVRELDPATGRVLATRRDGVAVRERWRRARVDVVRTSASSVISVAVRTRQGRDDRVLLDDVSIRRTRTTRPPAGPPAEGFPDAGSTGVPDGVALSAYAGPMTVRTAGAVIDAKRVVGGLRITARDVVITRSEIKGTVHVEPSGSVTITDSTVDGGTSPDSAVSQYNLTLRRVEVVGARASVGCAGNCLVEDSWLHGQYMPAGSDWHGDGFLTNGGDDMVLRHNTLACDSRPTGAGGACSAAVAAYGDFEPVTNLVVEGNFFAPSPAGFCMYAGFDPGKPHGRAAAGIVVTDNVFARGSNGRCAAYGPVTAVAPTGRGNVFSGNTWDDGRPLGRP